MKVFVIFLMFGVLTTFVVTDAFAQYGTPQTPVGAQISQIIPSDNNVFVIWTNYDYETKHHDWMLSRSTNYGNTFDDAVNITDGFFDKPTSTEIDIRLGHFTASENNIYTAWSEINEDDNTSTLYLKKSSDGGKTFDAMTLLWNGTGTATVSQIKAIKNSVYVIVTIQDGSDHKMLFLSSNDNGVSFDEPIDLTFHPRLVEDNVEMTVNENDIYIVNKGTYWAKNYGGAIFRHSDNTGKTFSDPINLSGNATVSIVKITNDEKNLYVLWAQHDSNNGIYLKKSPDHGESFTELVNVHSESGRFPQIAVDGRGGVFVKWAQANENSTHENLMFKRSLNWANTFDDAVKLAESRHGLSDTILGTQSDNSVFLVWLDSISEPYSRAAVNFMKSFDGGGSFEKVIDLNSDGVFPIINPKFAYDKNHIYVVGDTGSPRNHSIFFTSSDNMGRTFDSPIDLGVVNSNVQPPDTLDDTVIASPYEQLRKGIELQNIQCKENLVLIQKYDGSPACVTESTKTKLIERGWTASATTVTIYSDFEQNRDRTYTNPRNVIIDLEKDNSIKWVNNADYAVQVYDYENKSWSTGQIDPSMSDFIQFNNTGYYEFAVESAHDRHFGNVVVISENTNSLPLETRMKMGMAIVSNDLGKNPALIGVGTGDTNDGVKIDINQKELEQLDDAESFYYNLYKEMIPFDVPITIDFREPFRLLE